MIKYYCPRCGEDVEMKEDIFDKTLNFYCHTCKISGNIKAAKKRKF